MGLRSYFDVVKRYFPFNKEEKRSLVITILVLAIIIGMDDGRASFSLVPWLANFAIILVFVIISVFWRQAAHRLVAFRAGFRAEYRIWWLGILIGLGLTVISRGKWWIIIPGSVMAHHMAIHRLGWFRYGPNVTAISLIAMAGPIGNIILATIIKTIEWIFFGSNVLLHKIFIFNLAYAMWTMLPIPPLDGSKSFFHSRLVYAFVFACIAAYTVLAYMKVFSWIWALVIGFIIYLAYYLLYERTAWEL
jgi:hypothetical protein